jgi:hypothetical protein
MTICPHCGAKIEDDAVACKRCGKPTAAKETKDRSSPASGSRVFRLLPAVILVTLTVAAVGFVAVLFLREQLQQQPGVEADLPESAEYSDHGKESAEVTQIAQAVLGGSVMRAIAFKDASDLDKIVVLWSPSERSVAEDQVIVLERFAGNYVKRWSEDVYSVRTGELTHLLGVTDIDGDGYTDIVFPYFDYGASVETYSLSVYSPTTRKMYQVIAEYSGGSSPHIEFSPDLASASPEIKKVVENLAAKGSIIRPVDPKDGDLSLAKNAPAAWVKDNGYFADTEPSMTIVPRYYPGKVDSGGASIAATASDGPRRYISVFRSGVWCELPDENRHFVVWIPEDDYDWIQEMSVVGGQLVMKTPNSDKALVFDPMTNTLSRR